MMPMMRRQMEAMQQRMQEEVTAIIKDYDSSSKSNQKPSHN